MCSGHTIIGTDNGKRTSILGKHRKLGHQLFKAMSLTKLLLIQSARVFILQPAAAATIVANVNENLLSMI